jgi:hypothetical protein
MLLGGDPVAAALLTEIENSHLPAEPSVARPNLHHDHVVRSVFVAKDAAPRHRAQHLPATAFTAPKNHLTPTCSDGRREGLDGATGPLRTENSPGSGRRRHRPAVPRTAETPEQGRRTRGQESVPEAPAGQTSSPGPARNSVRAGSQPVADLRSLQRSRSAEAGAPAA